MNASSYFELDNLLVFSNTRVDETLNSNNNLLNKMSSVASFLNSEHHQESTNLNSREYVLLATLPGTDYIDNEVVNGNTYCYYVVASNVSGDSDATT
jgi:hypothetical protein